MPARRVRVCGWLSAQAVGHCLSVAAVAWVARGRRVCFSTVLPFYVRLHTQISATRGSVRRGLTQITTQPRNVCFIDLTYTQLRLQAQLRMQVLSMSMLARQSPADCARSVLAFFASRGAAGLWAPGATRTASPCTAAASTGMTPSPAIAPPVPHQTRAAASDANHVQLPLPLPPCTPYAPTPPPSPSSGLTLTAEEAAADDALTAEEHVAAAREALLKAVAAVQEGVARAGVALAALPTANALTTPDAEEAAADDAMTAEEHVAAAREALLRDCIREALLKAAAENAPIAEAVAAALEAVARACEALAASLAALPTPTSTLGSRARSRAPSRLRRSRPRRNTWPSPA